MTKHDMLTVPLITENAKPSIRCGVLRECSFLAELHCAFKIFEWVCPFKINTVEFMSLGKSLY